MPPARCADADPLYPMYCQGRGPEGEAGAGHGGLGNSIPGIRGTPSICKVGPMSAARGARRRSVCPLLHSSGPRGHLGSRWWIVTVSTSRNFPGSWLGGDGVDASCLVGASMGETKAAAWRWLVLDWKALLWKRFENNLLQSLLRVSMQGGVPGSVTPLPPCLSSPPGDEFETPPGSPRDDAGCHAPTNIRMPTVP